ncbi:MAG: response regulator transcription factor [Oscillospiraceae bacterium]
MPKILVADDEPDICRLIERYALREGYEVRCVSDGQQAVELCSREDFDAIVMDVMMPGMDGFTACREIHKEKDIPVLMLSARGMEYDKLYGFESGADDYVTKPFSPKELMARLNVMIRRNSRTSPEKEMIRLEGLDIDVSGREVFIDGERTELTAKEFDLLLYLVRSEGIVLTRDKILNGVWGYEYFGDDRTVDWQIKLLRGKLGKYRSRIHTVRGVGYKFEK